MKFRKCIALHCELYLIGIASVRFVNSVLSLWTPEQQRIS